MHAEPLGSLLRDEQEQAGAADPRCGDVVEEQLGRLVTKAQLAVMSLAAHTQSALALTKTGVYTLSRTKTLGLFRVGHRAMASGRWSR